MRDAIAALVWPRFRGRRFACPHPLWFGPLVWENRDKGEEAARQRRASKPCQR